MLKQLLLPKGAREELGIVGDSMEAPSDENEADVGHEVASQGDEEADETE